MKKKRIKPKMGISVLLFSALFLVSSTSFARQENKVDPKLLDELIGGYKCEIQGQKGTFVFRAKEGKLLGAPAGEEPLVLELVEGKDMTFVGHTPDGAEQFFKFLRNEEGKVAKCILSIPAAGLVIDMFRLEE